MLGTNEILASKHDIAKGQRRSLWDLHLGSFQFFVFSNGCLEAQHIYLYDSNMYFIIYEFCFTNFEVEYKRSYIFQSSSSETSIIDIRYGLYLGSMWPINCGFKSFKENAYFLAEPPQNGSAEPHS